jgi:glycine dehydrogenase subunit 2
VDEAMLIEPTETERLETLDAFADALLEIAREARATPDLVTSAPHSAPVRRLDEATAARQPNLRWRPASGAPGTDASAVRPRNAPEPRQQQAPAGADRR